MSKREYSGKFVVRVGKELHKALADQVHHEGGSLNGLVKSILEAATKKDKKKLVRN